MFCFIEIMNDVNGVNSVNTVTTVNTVNSVNTANPQNAVNTVNTVNTVTYNDNSHMKNQKLNVGVVVPPDDHYKPILYSDIKATASFNRLNQDIYDGVKKSKDPRKKKTPLSVKILLGIGAIAAAIFGISKLIRR